MGPLLLKKFRIIQIPVIPISHLHFRQVSREGANLPTRPVFSRYLEYICIPDLHSRFGNFSALNLVDKRCNSEFFYLFIRIIFLIFISKYLAITLVVHHTGQWLPRGQIFQPEKHCPSKLEPMAVTIFLAFCVKLGTTRLSK